MALIAVKALLDYLMVAVRVLRIIKSLSFDFDLNLIMVDFEEDYLRKEYPKLDEVEFDPEDADKFKDENMYKFHENT